MHVVEGAAAGGSRAVSGEGRSKLDLVPADVRNSQTSGAQGRDLAGDQPQPFGHPELLGALEQQLHPQADAE